MTNDLLYLLNIYIYVIQCFQSLIQSTCNESMKFCQVSLKFSRPRCQNRVFWSTSWSTRMHFVVYQLVDQDALRGLPVGRPGCTSWSTKWSTRILQNTSE